MNEFRLQIHLESAMFAWWIGGLDTALQAVILARGATKGMLPKYPFFYIPLLASLVGSVAGLAVFRFDRAAYVHYFWVAEFATLGLCCANIPEILRHLCGYSGATRRFAVFTNASLAVSMVGFGLAFILGPTNWNNGRHFYILERNFRATEALIYVAMVAGILYFGVPLGQNLKGILLGYGLYVGASLLICAAVVRFPHFLDGWSPVPSVWNGVCFIIYLRGLWNYDPPPQPEHATALAARVREALNSYVEYCKARLRLRPAVQ
jgi:hypothetical protein